LPKTIANIEDGKQVIKAPVQWVQTTGRPTNHLKNAYDTQNLIQEANELKMIFSSVQEKSK